MDPLNPLLTGTAQKKGDRTEYDRPNTPLDRSMDDRQQLPLDRHYFDIVIDR